MTSKAPTGKTKLATLQAYVSIAEYSIENNNWKSRVITVLIENAASSLPIAAAFVSFDVVMNYALQNVFSRDDCLDNEPLEYVIFQHRATT